jgi:hypothetical protein
MESDNTRSPFNEWVTVGTMEEQLFFAPPLSADAPPPELFEDEFRELEYGPIQLPKYFEDAFFLLHDPTQVLTPPSAFTYSTESGYDIATSEYSYLGPPSNYSMPSDMAYQGPSLAAAEYGGVDTIDDPSHTFVPLTPFPTSPPLRMAEAHSDYGPLESGNTFFTISPDNLGPPHQQIATPSAPVVLPVQPELDTQRSGKTFRCFTCGHGRTDRLCIFPWLTLVSLRA